MVDSLKPVLEDLLARIHPFAQEGYVLLTLLLAVVGATFVYSRKSAHVSGLPSKHSSSPNPKEREFGGGNVVWNPVQFSYPPVNPYVEELKDVKPIPYRPFRWGKYNVTMGIRNMPWDDWIELDNQYETYHRIRAHRIRTRGTKAVRVLDDDASSSIVGGGGKAAVELVHELSEYLSRRYPTTFQVVRHSSSESLPQDSYGWDGLPSIKTITVNPIGTSYDLPLGTDDGERASERAMEISALLVQDDLALMIEGADGRYYFQAGAICVPGFWRMQDKIGLPLDEIHITGNVPQYREKLHTSLARFFRRLPVDKPVIRNNYFIQLVQSREAVEKAIRGGDPDALIDPEELAWSASSNGPEDEFAHGHAFSGPPPDRPVPTPETLRFRTERQTLRRLPKTGAVLFTIRTYVVPIEELAKERGVPGRMANAVRGWGEDIVEYKGMERGGWGPVLLDYLDACHRGQVERGEESGEGGYPY